MNTNNALAAVDAFNTHFDRAKALMNVLGIEEEDMPAEVVDGTRVGLADAGKAALREMKQAVEVLAKLALARDAGTPQS